MKKLLISLTAIFISANITFAQNAITKQAQVSAELSAALTQQKKENEEKTFRANYEKILQAHKDISAEIRAYIKGYFGTEYQGEIPLKCEHSLSYVDKKDFMDYSPECANMNIVYMSKCPDAARFFRAYPANVDYPKEYDYGKNNLDEQTLAFAYKHIPTELVMVDGVFAQQYIDGVKAKFRNNSFSTNFNFYKKDSSFYNLVYRLAKKDYRRRLFDKEDYQAYLGCYVDFVHSIDWRTCNIQEAFNSSGKPWENKIHKVKKWAISKDYKCEETLSQAAKYGIK